MDTFSRFFDMFCGCFSKKREETNTVGSDLAEIICTHEVSEEYESECDYIYVLVEDDDYCMNLIAPGSISHILPPKDELSWLKYICCWSCWWIQKHD